MVHEFVTLGSFLHTFAFWMGAGALAAPALAASGATVHLEPQDGRTEFKLGDPMAIPLRSIW